MLKRLIMSTAVVTTFPSKVDQENRLKSRKVSKQSGLRPPNRQTENRGSSKKYTSFSQVTPRRALNELSGNVPSTARQSEVKHQGHTAVGIPPSCTKRQVTGADASAKKSKVDKHAKSSSENFPDIEALPSTTCTGVDTTFVPPFYFKELSDALKHTSYVPKMLQDPPQQPVLSLLIPRRPLFTHGMTTIDIDLPDSEVEYVGEEASLPELPNFDL